MSEELNQGSLKRRRVDSERPVREVECEVHGPELRQPAELLVGLEARERLVVQVLGTVEGESASQYFCWGL